MKNFDRRTFIKKSSLSAASLYATSNLAFSNGYEKKASGGQYMGDFAAPKIQTVRIAIIGVGGRGYGHAKQELYEKSVELFGPMQARFDEIMSDTDALEEILVSGGRKARETARPVLRRVRDLVGLPSTDPYRPLAT